MAKGFKLIVFVLFLLLSQLTIEARVLKSYGRREKGSMHLSRKLPSLHATLTGCSVKNGVVSEKKGYDKSSGVKHRMDLGSTSNGHSPGVGHSSHIG
ncbi:hypothetical protein AMTRI_Chr04g186130 [Amborella trichopoda]